MDNNNKKYPYTIKLCNYYCKGHVVHSENCHNSVRSYAYPNYVTICRPGCKGHRFPHEKC